MFLVESDHVRVFDSSFRSNSGHGIFVGDSSHNLIKGNLVSRNNPGRTYGSLRAALRDDPVYIAEQLGHADPTFTLRVYAKATKRRERLTGDYRTEFERACEWARMGTNAQPEPERPAESVGSDTEPGSLEP